VTITQQLQGSISRTQLISRWTFPVCVFVLDVCIQYIYGVGSIREGLIYEKWIFVRTFQVFFIIQRTCGREYLIGEKMAGMFSFFPLPGTLEIKKSVEGGKKFSRPCMHK
jgi:hypothetical protein